MAGFGCLLIVVGLALGLTPLLYVTVAGPDMTRLEFARHYRPGPGPAVVLAAAGALLYRRGSPPKLSFPSVTSAVIHRSHGALSAAPARARRREEPDECTVLVSSSTPYGRLLARLVMSRYV